MKKRIRGTFISGSIYNERFTGTLDLPEGFPKLEITTSKIVKYTHKGSQLVAIETMNSIYHIDMP